MDPNKELIAARRRIGELEKVLRALVAQDQGLHDDPKRPVVYVRLSTPLRRQIDDLLAPPAF
jgi:hypothetical protein